MKDRVKAVLQRIAEGDWNEDGDEFTFSGEAADGEPSWKISVASWGCTIRREIGIYTQEWDDGVEPEHLVHFAQAMDTASKTMNDYLSVCGF